MDGWLGA